MGIVKVRIQGLPIDVLKATESIRESFNIYSESTPYVNKNSEYIRVYIEAEKKLNQNDNYSKGSKRTHKGDQLMAVDDHAIDSLRTWFELEYDELKKEWKSGRYAKLSDCPSFESTSAYRDAMNVLIKALYLPEYVEKYRIAPLKKKIDEDLKFERGYY